ncbi:uncharacterized protein LOC5513054 isoform X2 [Nematostella vectensis]|uniref:uncharacterized protein LOC5513054 isoform X2 n=1 Tax=Nematostella vectensis TaxID=45351 RepID=UPI002076F8B6|nr:uncharacterized protein LOC5513054 isoform X2 [Nematostella vectensis]
MLKFLKGKSSKHEGKEDEEKHKAKKSSKDEKKHKKDKKKEKAASMGSLDGAGATTETRKIKKEKRKQKAASMASLDGSGPTIEKKKWRFGKKKTYEIGEAGGVTSVTKTTETRTETRPGGKTVTTTEVRTTRTRSDQRHPGVLLVQADKHDERAGRITDWNQEVDISGNRETSKIHVQKENGKRMENGKEFREDARIRSSNEEELISPEDKIESLQGETGPRNKVVTPGGKVVLIVTRKTSSGGKPAAVSDGKNVDRGNKMDPPKNVSPQMEKDIVKEEVNVQNAERSVDLPSWLEEVKEGDKPKDKMDGTVDIAFDVQGRNKPSLHSEPAVVETVKEEQVENSPEIDWSKLEDPQRRNTFTKTIITKRVKVTIPGNISQEDFTDGSSQTSEKYADMTPKRRSGIWLVDIHRSPANKTSEFEHRDPFHVDLSVSDPERSVDSYVTDGLEAEPTESRQEFTEDVDKVITTDSEPQIIHLSLESSPGSRDVTTTSEKRKSRDKYPKLEYITSLDLEDIEVLKSPDKQRPELQRQDVVTRTLTQSAVNELHTSPQNGAEPVDYKKGAKKIPGRKDSSDSSSSESDSDHEEGNLRSKMRKAEFHTNGLPGSSHHDYEPVYAAVDFDAKRKKRTETGRVGKQAHSEPESNYEKLKFPHQSDYMKLQYPTKITTTNDEQVKTDNGPAHKQHFSMVDVTVGQDSTDGFQETRVRDSLPVKVEMHQRSDDGTTSSSSSDSEGMADKKEQLRRAEQQARPTHGIRPKNWDIREKGTEIYQGENLSNRGSEDLKYWEIVGERDQANKELEFDVTTKETYKPAREGFVHRQLIYHAPKTDTTDLPRQSGTARENGLIEKRTMRTTTTITNGDGKTVTTTTRDVTDDKATRTTKTVTSEHTDNAEHVDERVSAWASDGNNDPSVRMKDPSVEFTKTRRAQETGKAVEVQPPRTASKELLADFEVFRSKQQAPNKAVGRSDEVTNEVAVSHQSRRIVESETVRKGTAQELHSENSALDIDSISSEGPGDTDMSRRIITTTQVSTTRRSGPDGKTTTTTREVVDSGGRQRVTESTRTSPGIGRYDYTSARRNITEYSPSQSINTESSPSRSTRTDRFDRSYSPRKYDLEKPRANGDEDGEITEEIVVVNKKKKVRLPKNFLDPEPSKPPRATIPLDKLVDAPARKKKEPVRYRNQVRENVRPSQSEKREAPDLALLEKITRELGKNKN